MALITHTVQAHCLLLPLPFISCTQDSSSFDGLVAALSGELNGKKTQREQQWLHTEEARRRMKARHAVDLNR